MLKVFIADDSIVIRSRLKETLEDQSCIKVIGEAGNARQAITDVRKLDPQVVIIDIRMPEGGGLPVLEDIKARNPEQIVIVLTSFPYPQYIEVYKAAGADYFYDKANDIPKLVEVLVDLANRNDVLIPTQK